MFIQEQSTNTQPRAMWRLAELVYKERVVEPAERRGIKHPPWTSEEIRIHYCHHVYRPKLNQLDKIRCLRATRELLTRRMVREDEDGALDPDGRTTDQLLKVCAAETKEQQLLSMLEKTAAPTRGASGKSAAGANGEE